MKIADVKKQSDAELHKLVEDNRAKLAEFRRSLRTQIPKNIREARVIKRTIARSLTEINERRLNKETKTSDKESVKAGKLTKENK